MNEKKPIKNKIKIKVQSQISPVVLFFVFIIILGVVGGLIYMSFHTSSSRSGDGIGELIALLVVAIPLLVQNAMNKEEYVSDLILSKTDLTLIYKEKRKLKAKQVIPLKDIKSFNVVLNANLNKISSKTTIISSYTTVKINTVNGVIEFSEDSSTKFTFCNYKFILNLLKVSYYIPHFRYSVIGNAAAVKEDVDYFAVHGKRIPFSDKMKKQWAEMSVKNRIVTSFVTLLILVPLLGIGYLIYTELPPVLNKTEKEFMSYYEKGYNARQNEDYKTAIEMFEKAEKLYDKDPEIFYLKAYCYEKTGEYETAIETAKEGLNHLNEKSIYKKAKKYNFNLHFDLYLYSVIGDSNYKLGRYTEAKDAYSYIIENGRNAWYYYRRGKAEYYLGEYKDAMSDFLTYKANIETSMHSEYPMYDEDDLKTVNKWIDKTQEIMISQEKNR